MPFLPQIPESVKVRKGRKAYRSANDGKVIVHKPHTPTHPNITHAVHARQQFLLNHALQTRTSAALETFASKLFQEVVQRTWEFPDPNPLRTAGAMYLLERVSHELITYRPLMMDLAGDIFGAVYVPDVEALRRIVGQVNPVAGSCPIPLLEPYMRRTYFDASGDLRKKMQQAKHMQRNAELFAARQSAKINEALHDWGRSCVIQCFKAWRGHTRERREVVRKARKHFIQKQLKESVRGVIRTWIEFAQIDKVNSDAVKQVERLGIELTNARQELNRCAARNTDMMKVVQGVKEDLAREEKRLQCEQVYNTELMAQIKQLHSFCEETLTMVYGEPKEPSALFASPSVDYRCLLVEWGLEMVQHSSSSLDTPGSLHQAMAESPSPFDATHLACVLCGAFPQSYSPEDVFEIWSLNSLHQRADRLLRILPRCVHVGSLLSAQQIAQGDPLALTMFLSFSFFEYAKGIRDQRDAGVRWNHLSVWCLAGMVNMVTERVRSMAAPGGLISKEAPRQTVLQAEEEEEPFAKIPLESLQDILPSDPGHSSMGAVREKWRQVLLSRANILQRVFDSYSSWSLDGAVKGISLDAMWRLVKECRFRNLLSSASVARLLRLMTVGEVDTSKNRNVRSQGEVRSNHSFDRVLFVEFLIRISHASLVDLQVIVDEYLSYACCNHQTEWTRVMRDIRVRNIVSTQHDVLFTLFTAYAIVEEEGVATARHGLSKDKWISLASDLGWIDDLSFTDAQAKNLFLCCQSPHHTDVQTDIEAMDFHEFSDGIVGVCVYKDPDPYAETHTKLQSFLETSILPYIEKLKESHCATAQFHPNH